MTSFQQGILLSLLTVVLWAGGDVFYRIASVTLQVEPIIFTCLAQISAALVLILVAGPGRFAANTLRAPHTWAFGLFQTIGVVLFIYALKFISTTEANFILRISLLMSLAISWLFLDRRPRITDLIGISVSMLGIIYLVYDIDAGVRAYVFALLFLQAFTITMRAVVMEVHPVSLQAISVKDRCRVTGVVMFVTGGLLLLFFFLGAFFKESLITEQTRNIAPLFALFPDLSAFTVKGTFFAGLFMGGTILSLYMYTYFEVVKKIKSELFLMVAAFLPVATLFWEYLASLFHLLDISSVETGDLIAGAVIVSGALFMVAMRYRQESKGA